MNPGEIVETLRGAYNEVQDGTLTIESAEVYIEMFDELDSMLMGGSPLPREWRR